MLVPGMRRGSPWGARREQERIVAVIPALNAASTLPDVVRRVRDTLRSVEICVVDDGSDDDTALVAELLGCLVMRHARNIGKGAALRTGFAAVKEHADTIFTLDADGQHDPGEMPLFLPPLREGRAEVVVGNRMSTRHGMPLDRYLSNRLSSLIVSWVAGVRVPDSQCGFRAFRKEVLDAVLLTTSHFDTESEFIVRCARAGFRIESVPITTHYEGQASSISRAIDSFRFVKLMMVLLKEFNGSRQCRTVNSRQ
ncbi:MAG: glycosyltransferase family 2 protein [candidate division KSB1 bacterium]|nr:glycosyltransferase family 2 protein [candidate division KSB1 bacterium]MDZ7378574.1 glycosyltransferase family 2 protein [candidate division KSB1 bacterium]MDZ7393758.1 glycosyltransferase family 2 protein [candidate division KSB1 bacterium]